MGTIRFRLTLWYAALFLAAGVVLLALVFILVQRAFPSTDPDFAARVTQRPGARVAREALSDFVVFPRQQTRPAPVSGARTEAVLSLIEEGRVETRREAMRTLVVQSSVALLAMGAISVGAGWWMAGRMLRPVAGIMQTVREINDARLADHRLDLDGPRDELRELADQFDAMLDRLDAAFRAQREFVANASHELRTPLAVMRAELDVTFDEENASPEELRAGAEVIRRAITRSEALIDALLTLERADAPRERSERIDLVAQVEAVLHQHSKRANERGIEVRADLEPAELLGDPVLVERMIDNLVSNAVAYAEASPGDVAWVSVSARSIEGECALRVENAAQDVDPEGLEALFDRFWRGDSSRSRDTGGHGLGLAIVRAVARHHGGDARAEAVPGGIAFEVRLPAAF